MASIPGDPRLKALKESVKGELADRLNLSDSPDAAEVERLIAQTVAQVNRTSRLVPDSELGQVVSDIADDYLRLGPIQKLMGDPTISEIMVNGGGLNGDGVEGPIPVYIERAGKIEPAPQIVFDDSRQKRQIIERIAAWCGRTVNEEMPILNARLPDGSRVCAVISPIAIDGDTLDIRRFRKEMLSMADLVRIDTMTPEMADMLAAFVEARCNIIVAGGTGAGKTTLLNCLSEHIPENERIVTIEDTAELQLNQAHTLRYEGRPQNSEGAGKITIHDLVVMALRDRPDRIIVGECRSDETLEMLQAMQTGHDGSLTTIHANDPQTAFKRIETMVLGSAEGLPSRAIREQIAGAVDVVVQISRLVDGTRRITAIEAVTGMEGEAIVHEPLVTLKELGRDEHGNVVAEFQACGTLPPESIRAKLDGQGVPWRREWFFGSKPARVPAEAASRQAAQGTAQVAPVATEPAPVAPAAPFGAPTNAPEQTGEPAPLWATPAQPQLQTMQQPAQQFGQQPQQYGQPQGQPWTGQPVQATPMPAQQGQPMQQQPQMQQGAPQGQPMQQGQMQPGPDGTQMMPPMEEPKRKKLFPW